MQIVRDLGGYTMGRSDLVRRAMSKKKGVRYGEKSVRTLSMVMQRKVFPAVKPMVLHRRLQSISMVQ